MQDKTINNALIALAKQGGTQAKLADVLLDMRGVSWSGIVQDNPMQRGRCKRFALECLRDGPKTTTEIADALQAANPDMTRKSAQNRCYQSLLRLADQGHVVQDFGPDGCLWRVSQL